MLSRALFSTSFSVCFILGWPCAFAQTPAAAPAAAATTAAAAPSQPTALNAATSVSATDPLISVMSVVTPNAGKYEEYQSICRLNEYGGVAYEAIDAQAKRIENLNENIKKSPSNTVLKLQLLKEYIDQGKKTAVETFYTQIKTEKMSEEANKIADSLFLSFQGNKKKAETQLAKVLIDDPKNAEALEFLADIYRQDANYFDSTAAYLDLIKLTKLNYDAQVCEVQTLDSQHNEAEKTCKTAAKKFPSDPYPLIFLGVSQREKLNYSEALRYFKESLLRRTTEMGYTCLAEVYFIKENYSGASELFKRATEIYPSSGRAVLGLAWSEFKNKKLSSSLASFKKACTFDRRVKGELRKAFKILADEKSASAKLFADLAQNCSE